MLRRTLGLEGLTYTLNPIQPQAVSRTVGCAEGLCHSVPMERWGACWVYLGGGGGGLVRWGGCLNSGLLGFGVWGSGM